MMHLSKHAKTAASVLGILLLIGLCFLVYSSAQEKDSFRGGAPSNPGQPSPLPVEPSTTTESAPTQSVATPQAEPAVRILSIHIPVELARSQEEVRKGLSGRPSLAADKGMLFIFPEPDFYRFWMPDMNFPIDIVWINSGKVVDISHNVSNEFDPENPRFYIPSEPAQFVLEVNAGFAADKDMRIGDSVTFENVPA